MNTEKGLNLVKNRLHDIFENGRLRNKHEAEELLILLKCCEELKEKEANKSQLQPALSEFEDAILGIEEELSSAKNYLDMYTESNDPDLKIMAQDELRHAAKLIKLCTPKAVSNQEKTRLAQLNAKYQMLVQKTA